MGDRFETLQDIQTEKVEDIERPSWCHSAVGIETRQEVDGTYTNSATFQD